MLICVTNRKLCRDDLLQRINRIAKGKPHAIILREKDLGMAEFTDLAEKIKEICDANRVLFIINQKIAVAAKLKINRVNLSMADLLTHRSALDNYQCGASVHSVREAKVAEALGVSYMIAGHIFPTDSKKGVPPRGLSFLKEVSAAVAVPVFAIGGITKDKVKDVLRAGASGICVMSEAMTCADPVAFIREMSVKANRGSKNDDLCPDNG
ncbi:MAG TPA: thiamine phosphate synthase [Firmicutes bacterium]|nr:thiamine phosphate synthase [Bacillota bacterium]